MADITVRAITSGTVELQTATDTMNIHPDDAPAYLEAFQAQGYSVRVELGQFIGERVRQTALDLAGLSSYQAAKQTAKGYIEL
jgi:hypothetical protein